MRAIILAAGQGSRLLPLTLDMPKCLVSVGGAPILDQQLAAAKAAGITAVTVVGGYRIEQVAAHLAAHDFGLSVALVFNPFWAAASSIGSVWAVRADLSEPFVLMNGDTLFDHPILTEGIAGMACGVNLLVEPLDHAEHDDMCVRVEADRVVAVDKALADDRATHRSLGVILSDGGSAYGEALERVIAAPEGIHAFHHAVVAHLAPQVTALSVDRSQRWQEIDRPEDIDRWRAGH